MAALLRSTPVLRCFDETKAREFYVGFLDFKIEFEHRFSDDAPLYMGLSRGAFFLHLTEHQGDACPGAALRIEKDDIAGLCADLAARNCRFARPGGPETTPWGTREITITDPFGNRLTFFQSTMG